jgi:hypothetical protein
MLNYYHARVLVAVCLLPGKESALNSFGNGDCMNCSSGIPYNVVSWVVTNILEEFGACFFKGN